MRLRWFVVLLAALAWNSSANAALRWVRMEEPRNFGYFVGDVIERHAYVLTDPDDQLLPASQPKPGPVNYWLDLVRVEIHEGRAEGGRLYRITLAYQTFYTPLDPRKLTIPAWPLAVGSNTNSTPAAIPAFVFTASPIRELFPEKSGETKDTFLRADIKPQAVALGDAPTALAFSATATLASLLLLARHRAWWPFQERPGRPFAQTSRLIARLRKRDSEEAAYRDALTALHRAFDETAKRRVLAEDVSAFLERHPAFAVRRAEVEYFFQSSRRAFYGDDIAGAAERMPLHALEALSVHLAEAERTYA